MLIKAKEAECRDGIETVERRLIAAQTPPRAIETTRAQVAENSSPFARADSETSRDRDLSLDEALVAVSICRSHLKIHPGAL